jgi:hypothetical protein
VLIALRSEYPRLALDKVRGLATFGWKAWWLPVLTIVVGTLAISWGLLASPFQFAINDFGPFGSHMLQTCLASYEPGGLGHENPHTIPSFCDYGALSIVLGGANAEHLFLVGCFAISGVSMFFLLRRIGNQTVICLIGALAYELSPVMLSFQLSGEGLLVTAALLPAILLGAIPTAGRSPWVDGARSGALLALASYANPQAPAFVVFLLLPAVGLWMFRRLPGDNRSVLEFSASFVAVYLLAAMPVLIILPSFASTVQQVISQGDFGSRLASSSLFDFFTPYLLIGVIPAIIGFLTQSVRRDIRLAEQAAAVSFISIVVFWEVLRVVGPAVATVFPLVTMYKDFVKLELVLAVPLVILSARALRLALSLRTPINRAVQFGAPATVALLLLLPVALGSQPRVIYITQPTSTPGLQALQSGQFGLPAWSRVPSAYTDVLGVIRKKDPDTRSYRVLWTPIDWRLVLMSRTTDMNLLLYSADGSPESRSAILRTYHAIANDEEGRIAPLLADQGAKYVVVDLADGQDRNNEPWQQGPPRALPLWGTQALVGDPEAYRQILSKSPGMTLMQDGHKWLIYQNQNWRPILQSYKAQLTVPTSGPEAAASPSQGAEISLLWKGSQGASWKVLSDGSIRIDALHATLGQTAWSPVSAVMPVVSGTSYQIAGQMEYNHVLQAHAKVIWRGTVDPRSATTYLGTGHSGTGTAALDRSLVAPAGATSAELFLMGGWSESGIGYTQYDHITARPLTSPNFSTLQNSPDLLMSLRRELPDMLIEAGVPSQNRALEGVTTLTLRQGVTDSGTAPNNIRLLTASNFKFSGRWIVNASPDPLGIEHLASLGGGTITIAPELLKTAPPGSKIVWIEYKSGEQDPTNGVVHSVNISSNPVTIACGNQNCTVANVLLVPPMSSGHQVSRLAYAYSPLLQAPNGDAPVAFRGDWATLYPRPPQGYPSAIDGELNVFRLLELVFGHLFALIGLLIGFVRR